MASERKTPNVLLHLAAEGMAPAIGRRPVDGEKAIDRFGPGIVERWRQRFVTAEPGDWQVAVSELAATSVSVARVEAAQFLAELAPGVDPEQLAFAADYLSILPKSIDRALVVDATGRASLAATITFDDAQGLLPLLPHDVPPYPTSVELPGTPYRLEELIGSGGFGAVYRASSRSLQHLPLAIKFCLDRSLLPALNLERSNLERLMRAAGERGASHVVRLYGYDLDHATPYLVYEYVAGGDLTAYIAGRRAALGRPLNPDEIRPLVVQIAEGLAFAHRAGLVHRDVKPANVLADGDILKLADFGLGGVAVKRAVQRSRIGMTTIDFLSMAEQASLFRGAGTPLYMSPEQRRGATPDPKHDLYSLGVLWFQLLCGDVTRELHPGWAKELVVRFNVPAEHIALIDRCVGWFDERPKDASELLPLLKESVGTLPVAERVEELPSGPAPPVRVAAASPSPASTRSGRESIRRKRLMELLADLERGHSASLWPSLRIALIWAAFIFVLVFIISAGYLTADSRPHSISEIFAVSLAFGVGFSVGLTGFFLVGWRLVCGVRRILARRNAIWNLESEYASDLADWGGVEELRSPGIITTVIEQLRAPGFQVSLDLVSRPALKRNPLARTAVPIWAAILLSLPIGGLFGAWAGLLIKPMIGPLRHDETRAGMFGPNDVGKYYSIDGSTLSASEFVEIRDRANRIAVFAGIFCGVMTCGVATWQISRRRRYQIPTQVALFIGLFALGLPLAIGTHALIASIGQPRQISKRDGFDASIIGYADQDGVPITGHEYARRVAMADMYGGLLGGLLAAVVTFGLVAGVRYRWATMAQGTDQPPDTNQFAPPGFDVMQTTVLAGRLREYKRQLEDHRLPDRVLKHSLIWGGLPVAFVTYQVMKLVSGGFNLEGYSICAGILTAAGIVGVNLAVRWYRSSRLRAARADLATAYATVFAAWGGPGFLNDPAAIESVLKRLPAE